MIYTQYEESLSLLLQKHNPNHLLNQHLKIESNNFFKFCLFATGIRIILLTLDKSNHKIKKEGNQQLFIFELYKKRWSIETFYNYFKNEVDINALHTEDYHMTQGLSFIMLIVGLIHSEFSEAMREVKGKTIEDVLLEGRFIKTHKYRGKWGVENIKKERLKMMKLLNIDFEDIDRIG